jgi:hypothetical protein
VPGGEELVQGMASAEAPVGCGGQIGLDDGEVGKALQGPLLPTGGALLHFYWPDGSFSNIVRKFDGQIGGEPEDHVPVDVEPFRQSPGMPGQDTAGGGGVVGAGQGPV